MKKGAIFDMDGALLNTVREQLKKLRYPLSGGS